MYTRRIWFGRALAGAALMIAGRPLAALAERKPEVRIYRHHFTQCCTTYMSYLRENGFAVVEETVSDLAAVKADYSIPESLISCHTAVCSGYVFEGHVPADLIHKLLKERPMLKGLAVPGVPAGAPGTPATGTKQPYTVMQIGVNGEVKPYEKR